MARIVVENLGRFGMVKDRPPHTLPLEAWSDCMNVRFYEDSAQKILGHSVAWTPAVDAIYLLPLTYEGARFWIYCGLTAVYAVDSAGTHANITRASGAYNATFQQGWTGGVFNGKVILNNGVDAPQMWSTPSLGTQLTELTGWPAGYAADAVRPLGNFLVAVGLTKSGLRFPYSILWSHIAQPGAVPSSWDVTDPTKDAGEASVGDTGGALVDLVPLRGVGMLYKKDSTWGLQYIGGTSVFRRTPVSNFGGLFTRHCARPFQMQGEKHFVVTTDDVVVHDGQNSASVIDELNRRWLFRQIDSIFYERTHVAHNSTKNEMWIAIPGPDGQCNLALIMNYKTGKWSIRDLPDIGYMSVGPVSYTENTTWDSDLGSWALDDSTWSDNSLPAQTTQILMSTKGAGRKLLLGDTGHQFNGQDFRSYVERVGLAVVAQDRQGEAKYDLEVIKLVTEVWPRIEATEGAMIDIYIGTQERLNQIVHWHGPYPFVVGTDVKICPLVSGRLLGIRFEMSGNASVKLNGYDLVLEPVGVY